MNDTTTKTVFTSFLSDGRIVHWTEAQLAELIETNAEIAADVDWIETIAVADAMGDDWATWAEQAGYDAAGDPAPLSWDEFCAHQDLQIEAGLPPF